MLGGLLGGTLGLALPGVVLKVLAARRAKRFEQQLPDVLTLVASSLSTGFSLPQALDAIVRDVAQPAAKEFSRAMAETRIGSDIEDALERMADRMDSKNMHWAAMAIQIQRKVGGNLGETLRTTATTLREREALFRHVRALSAEGRLSAVILIALPIVHLPVDAQGQLRVRLDAVAEPHRHRHVVMAVDPHGHRRVLDAQGRGGGGLMTAQTMLIAGAVLIFARHLVVVGSLVIGAGEPQGVARSLAIIERQITHSEVGKSELPARDRLLTPALDRSRRLGLAFSPKGTSDRLSRMLDVAGNPPDWPVERVLGAKGITMLLFAVSACSSAASP